MQIKEKGKKIKFKLNIYLIIINITKNVYDLK